MTPEIIVCSSFAAWIPFTSIVIAIESSESGFVFNVIRCDEEDVQSCQMFYSWMLNLRQAPI